MNINYADKKIKEVKPNSLELLEFMTLGVIAIGIYVFFSNFDLMDLDEKIYNEIRYVLCFQNILVLSIFALSFKIIDIVQWNIKLKRDCKYDCIRWRLLTEKFENLYFFVLSLYLVRVFLLNFKSFCVDLTKINIVKFLIVLLYLVIMVLYCISLIQKIFKKDEYDDFDYNYKKSEYLKETLVKFGKKDMADINKRLALLELYEKTSRIYDKGIRLDENEFWRKNMR